MKTTELLNCARPIFFENECDGYEYSISGTGFLVTFYQKTYVITAKHVLQLDSFSPDQIRIQYRPDNKEFIPIKELFTLRITDYEDTDQFDIAIMETDTVDCNNEIYSNNKPYNLLEVDRLTIFNPNSDFIFRGFPIEQRPINYQDKHIYHSAFIGSAKYLGPTKLASTHKLKLIGCKILKNPDGLSGSPVFQINQADQGYAREAFAGMLIRSSSKMDIAYFIEHRQIIDMLLDVQQGKFYKNN